MSNLVPALGFAALLASTAAHAETTKALPRSTPEKQGISSAAILDFVDSADRNLDSLHSFMLVRHGHVVAEGWWNPYNAQSPHMLYSLSKSFTSTGVGLAVAEGKLSLDDEVLKFFPEDAPANPSDNLKQMRVRDLLRMNTGHQEEPPVFWAPTDTVVKGGWVKKFLAYPVAFKPGTHFVYNTAATFMLSAIVQKATGQNLLDYLRPRLFDPLGIENPTWQSSPEGIATGGFGLNVRTEDIARFGQLYLQKGEWKGKQLLPKSWVEMATTLQACNGSNPNSDWDQGYCFQFWRCRHNAFRGDGAFGQYCLVMPDQDAVIAITSGLGDMQAVLNLVWDKLLPAMKRHGVDDDAASRKKLQDKLAGLTMHLPTGEATSATAQKVSGRVYALPENVLGIRTVSLTFGKDDATLLVQDASGELRTAIGQGAWKRSDKGFANGMEANLSVPGHPKVAACGAWSAPDTFTVKLSLYETPFISTLKFKFDGDQLQLESTYNVSFGPITPVHLVCNAVK